MPLVWDPELHKEKQHVAEETHKKEVEAAAALQAALETKLAEHLHPTKPLVPIDSLAESNWRNWVIKTLCGFQSHLLTRFVTLFPEHTEDFLHLHEEVGKVLYKVRQTNHRKAQQRSK